MKGDFSRLVDPSFGKRYTGVLQQQGRVGLDSDWNTQVAVTDRLARVTATDIIGPAGAPATGGGFAIGIGADGSDLTLSAGRIYVDGILCEVDADVTYTRQPHLPSPAPLTAVDGRTDLVYLDVWKRHVTAVEDPALLDPALNGLDTTTRLQTVWQVRLLAGVGDVACDAIPHFPPPRSGALLTSAAVATPDAADPCGVVVAGGYRGVENRLYRVEIHNPGDRGTATWKWSRDNGSVEFAIEEVMAAPASQLRLRSVGRDAVLTLRQDDWVELLDDASELSFTPGFMARVAKVDPVTRIVTLDRDVPAGTVVLAHQARVRRWDQGLGVDANGLLATGDGPFDLEDGIQVRFAGGQYRNADHWTMAARTPTGSIEELTDAPPHGIDHHYAPLALVRWSIAGDGTFTLSLVKSCRLTFPSLAAICAVDVCYDNTTCDLEAKTVQDAIEALCLRDAHSAGGLCTVTLGADGVVDLQQAVEELPPDGGCICIPAGTFPQRRPVLISGRRAITIEGCGPASAVVYEATDPPLFTVERSNSIVLRNFTVRCSNSGVVMLRGERSGVEIRDCTIECPQGVAFEADDLWEELSVGGCIVSAQQGFVLAAGSPLNRVFIRGNRLQAPEQIVRSVATQLTNLRIEDNAIEGSGLSFDSLPAGAEVTIARNRFTPKDKIAVQVVAMADRAVLSLADNQIGSADEPARQGVVIEKEMAPDAMLLLHGNRFITTGEALGVRDPANHGVMQVTGNVFRSLRSLPVISVGGIIDRDPGIGQVLFSNNQIYTDLAPADRGTVELNALRLVVMGNYVADQRQGDPRGLSIRLPMGAEAATAIGNISRNGVNLEGTPLPPTLVVVNNAVF